MTDPNRLERQLDFIAELDKLKSVERMISIIGGARRENSAEHSWHLALMAPLLAEYAPGVVDISRVQTMLLIHDVVEIDAGDVFCFDEEANVGKEERELEAADRLFGLLPDRQAVELKECWLEFEEGTTAEARYAVALDRFQGLLMNMHNHGGTWRLHGISREQVLTRMAPIREGAPALWDVVLSVLEDVGLTAQPYDGRPTT
jgi:putative hydrolase of HD superfamily